MWISNHIQGTMGEFWQVQTVNRDEYPYFWWICSQKMFPMYQGLVILVHNKLRKEFRSRTVLFWHFKNATVFFFGLFCIKIQVCEERKGWKGWRMVRKNYNHCFSFCEIFWVKLKAFFCSALQVEGIWNTSNILTTEKKKVKIYYSL